MISFFNVHKARIEEQMGEHRFWMALDMWHVSVLGIKKSKTIRSMFLCK